MRLWRGNSVAGRKTVDERETAWTEDGQVNEHEGSTVELNAADDDARETAADPSSAPTETAGESGEQLTGRSIFSIETTGAGVVVRTVFLTEDNRLLNMPMVFPDVMYAMDVIDDLKRQVAQHFSNAARVGGQVIASQAAAARQAAPAEPAPAASDQDV